MGLDLALGIERHPLNGMPPLCYQRLKLDARVELVEDELKSVAVPLPEGAYWYDDGGVEVVTTDCYGEPLTWVPAATLANRLEQLEMGTWDLASLGYLKAIPPGTRVVLWWC